MKSHQKASGQTLCGVTLTLTLIFREIQFRERVRVRVRVRCFPGPYYNKKIRIRGRKIYEKPQENLPANWMSVREPLIFRRKQLFSLNAFSEILWYGFGLRLGLGLGY